MTELVWWRVKRAKCQAVLACLVLVACSGGGRGGDDVTFTPAASDTPPTPAPVTPGTPLATDCDGFGVLNIAGVTDDGLSQAGFGPENVVDQDLSAASRWAVATFPATIQLDLGERVEVKDLGIAWHLGNERESFVIVEVSEDGTAFQTLVPNTASSGESSSFERYDVNDTPARFVRLTGQGTTSTSEVAMTEVVVFGCSLSAEPLAPAAVVPFDASVFGLDASAAPGANFDLLTWALDTPADLDNNNRADRTNESDLDAGFEDEFFFTGSDGGMVFRSTTAGATTSENTSFTRSELREMLRRGNTNFSTRGVGPNNWLLGYQPDPGVAVGGREGTLTATLSVNQVTSTGDNSQVGRVIIGQIHAEDDEPIRLYYRKFPQNDRGFIYFAHELKGGDDLYFMVVGPEYDDPERQPQDDKDPDNGIALNELFSYEIRNEGPLVDVIVRRGDADGEIIGHGVVDMNELGSGYDVSDEWMYFKAGAYTQNNTGDDADFDQVTFYRLSNTHN